MTFFRQIASQNLQRKNLGFSETGLFIKSGGEYFVFLSYKRPGISKVSLLSSCKYIVINLEIYLLSEILS